MIIITENFLSLLHFAIVVKAEMEEKQGFTAPSAELEAWNEYVKQVQDGDRIVTIQDR